MTTTNTTRNDNLPHDCAGLPKITRAQDEMLRVLNVGERFDIANESIVKALARKGLAERFVDRFGYTSNRHGWRITDVGRALVESSQ
jgi:hypothetical protein